MCRLLAYSGQSRRLADLVIAPSHSLLEQSQHAAEAKFSTNGDGFGISWYGDDPKPGRFRDVNPAWSDSNLPDLCRMVTSRRFLAHVRASTTGATTRDNCHPFVHENISFVHNGQLGGYLAMRRQLETCLSDTLYAQRHGTTDSELLFLLLIQHGLVTDPHGAICKSLELIRAHQSPNHINRITCVFSDGAHIWAFRHATDNRAPTLYMSQEPNGVILASEPLDPDISHWSQVPQNQLIRIRDTGQVDKTNLGLGQFYSKDRAAFV